MSTSIIQFLAKATGPSRLRSELHLKTKSVRTLLKALHPVSTVQTEVPQSVFGGDIVMLMSGRLRQALQYSEQPEIGLEAGSASRSRLIAQPGVGVSSAKTKFSVNPLSAKESANRWPLYKSMLQPQNRTSPTSSSSENVTKTDSFMSLPVPKVTQTDLEPEIGGPHTNQTPIPQRENRTQEPEQWKQTITPIFVKKLREYWQLSQQKQTSDSNPNRPVDVKKSGGKQGTSFSPLPDTPGVSHVWPEMTGEQIARKIHELASGRSVSRSAKHVQHTIHSSLPEKVEIQNIFNLEVKPDGDKGPGSSTDLSEKIADILHEQALQYGIDIT